MRKIGFAPIDKSDEYLDIIKRIFSDFEFELVDFNTEIMKRKPEFEFAYLNWFENMPHKSLFRNFLTFAKKIVILHKMKVKKIKFIYVCHNLTSHDKYGRHLSNIIIRKCLKQATVIAETVEATEKMIIESFSLNNLDTSKFKFVSIPNYEIEESKLDKTILKHGKNPIVLYFGLVRPYKNIELIITLAQKHSEVDFYVLGLAADEYKNQLLKSAHGIKNIYFDLRYLSNEELHSYISCCDAVILPYNKDSMLNSGSFRLAAILGKTTICPIIGNYYELNPAYYYFYDYENREEHFRILDNTLDKMLADIENDPKVLIKKGLSAKLEHVEKYNYSRIKNYYSKVIESLECQK